MSDELEKLDLEALELQLENLANGEDYYDNTVFIFVIASILSILL
jgi:hypothetical protein